MYLTKSLVLASLIKRKPLVVYIASLDEWLGALSAQENAEGKVKAKSNTTIVSTPPKGKRKIQTKKGQALAGFLVAHLVPNDSLLGY